MPPAPDLYPKYPETALVGLSQNGDRDAFAELVARRQVWIRHLMRRCCGDATQADDLSQQAFMQAWRSIRQFAEGEPFWPMAQAPGPSIRGCSSNAATIRCRMPPNISRPTLWTSRRPASRWTWIVRSRPSSDNARACIVLAYHERMTHAEIAEMTGFALGTVKSHVRRGTQKLQQELAAYDRPAEEMP